MTIECFYPFCRELLAIVKHGEVRIRPIKEGREVRAYHVDWIDSASGADRVHSGECETLQAAIEAAIIDRFGRLGPAAIQSASRPIIERLDCLAQEVPGSRVTLRITCQPQTEEMRYQIDVNIGDSHWLENGDRLEAVYCLLRNQMSGTPE